ncbi:MAG: RNA polymerase sigma factor [Clostridia bacterium]|nr:RNA polymerase sigma factor [Clostridia bacterium]
MLQAEECYRNYLNGDKSAFSDIIDIYRENLIFFINGYVKNEDTAEELAADCFEELIVHPGRFKFKSSLKTYIFSIAHHKAVNFIKKNARVTLYESTEPIEKSTDYTEFESDVLKDEQARILHDALPKIKEDYRTALHLVYFEEMSYKDAAKVMRKTTKQVDNYISRGKAALRKILEEEGFGYEE